MTDLESNNTYLATLKELLSTAEDQHELYDLIVNAPFHDKKRTTLMGLGIVVLLLVNKKENTVDRVALSKTAPAQGTLQISMVPFKEIKIPADFTDNYIVQAIQSGEPRVTSDWQFLFNPALTSEEARFNQAGGGIAGSHVYPIPGCKDGGAIIFSYYQFLDQLNESQNDFMKRYCEIVGKALEPDA